MAVKRYSLGQMFDALEKVPARDLTVDLMRDHVARLDIPKRVVDRHLRFCSESYTRSLVMKTGQFEVIVMGWKPGQQTRVHNHGDSFGVVFVWDGELRTTVFDRLDDGSVAGRARVKPIGASDEGDGQITYIDLGGIHRMACAPEFRKNLVTVHFYARPLTWVETYFPDQDRMEKMTVRYCFGEEDCRYFTEGPPFSCLQKEVIAR